MAGRVSSGGDPPVLGTCLAHSGLSTRISLVLGLLGILCGMFGWSSFIQLPAMESRMTEKSTAIERRLDETQRDIMNLKVEQSRIKAQRNVDHPKKDPIQ